MHYPKQLPNLKHALQRYQERCEMKRRFFGTADAEAEEEEVGQQGLAGGVMEGRGAGGGVSRSGGPGDGGVSRSDSSGARSDETDAGEERDLETDADAIMNEL